jgi:hypothetical protein
MCPERGITKAIGVEDGLVEVGFVGNSRNGLTVVLPRIIVEQTVPQPTPYQKRRFWTFWPDRARCANTALGLGAEVVPPVVLMRVSRRR